MSFWSLVLDAGKKYEKTVDNCIQVSMATLDTTKAQNTDDLTQIKLEFEGNEMTIANLSMKRNIFQCNLDLTFNAGDCVCFSSVGAKVPVTLTGIAGNTGDDDDEYIDTEEYEDTAELEKEMAEAVAAGTSVLPVGVKRKITSTESSSKARKMGDGRKSTNTQSLAARSFVSDDESDDDNYNPTHDPNLTKEGDLPSDEDAEDEEGLFSDDELSLEDEEGMEDEEVDIENMEDEDTDDEDEAEDEEEIVPEPKKKQKLLNGSAKKMESSTPKQQKVEKLKMKESKLTPSKNDTPSKKDIKKANKAMKAEAKSPKVEPKSPKAAPAVGSPSTVNKENVEKTPKKDKKKKNKNKEGKLDTPTQPKATPKSQLRVGGVLVEDISLGTGSEAKNGNSVSMYYEGRLKSTDKVFDKNLSGPPFKFRLGRGEVIKGWDIGVAGMRVGGKRKISVPAAMGYGKQGAPPVIPSQAHLNFVVTMLNCK